VRDILAVI